MEQMLAHFAGPSTAAFVAALLGIGAGLGVVLHAWMDRRLRERLRLAEKNDALEKRHEELRSQIEQSLKELGEVEIRRAEASQLADRIADLTQEWEGLADRRRELNAFHEETARKVEELALERETEDRKLEDLRRERAELDGVHAALEAKRAELAGATDEVRKIQAKREEVLVLEQRKAAIENTIPAAEKQLREAENRREESEKARDAAETDAKRLAERLDVLSREIDGKRREAEEETARARESKRQAERTAMKLVAAQRDLEAVTQACERARAREARLSEEIQMLEKRRKALARDNGDKADLDMRRVLAELYQPPQCLVTAKKDAWKTPRASINELQALRAVQDLLEKAGLSFRRRTIFAFHTALKVADISPMTVLAGISGTGKSQLPRRYCAAMGIHFLQVPVQPRWDSPQDLMGFYNFVDKRYRATELARLLVHMDSENWQQQAADWEGRMALVLLDEMNLARTEYYFSEFLSRLEMRPPRGATNDPIRRSDAEIELEIPGERKDGTRRIYAGHRVLFAGTMNEDESTQTLSDKVLDRSNVLRFTRPEKLEFQGDGGRKDDLANGYLTHQQWEDWINRAQQHGDRPGIEGAIEELNRIAGRAQRGFGHRMAQAIERYAWQYPDPADWRIAVADQIEMRLLPKLRGVDLTDPPTELAIKDLIRYTKDELDDSELGDAIRRDVSAGEERGLFAWTGLDRQ